MEVGSLQIVSINFYNTFGYTHLQLDLGPDWSTVFIPIKSHLCLLRDHNSRVDQLLQFACHVHQCGHIRQTWLARVIKCLLFNLGLLVQVQILACLVLAQTVLGVVVQLLLQSDDSLGSLKSLFTDLKEASQFLKFTGLGYALLSRLTV